MNKSLFLAMTACAAMAMTSCSSEDLTSGTTQANETPISFSTYLGRAAESRVGETTSTSIQTSGFGVFASYTTDDWNDNTPNFMFNQKVDHSQNGWSYTPVKYWTNSGKFSFFAYAPYGTDNNGITTYSENTAAGAPVLKITVPTDVSKMIDFVAANAMNKTYSTSDDGEVKFVLKHEMTRAAFKATTAQGIDGNTSVTVTGITLKGTKLYKEATYQFASTETGTWNPSLQETENTITLSNLSVTGEEKSPYLYLIPVSDLGENDVTVVVDYTVTTTDSQVDGGKVTTSGTQTVKLPKSTLEQGKSYVFTFSIGLNEIKLSATVDNWTDIDSNIDVQANN